MRTEILKVAASFVLAFAFTFATCMNVAQASERVLCTITMPTDGGTYATSSEVADAGCQLLSDGGVTNCRSPIPKCNIGRAQAIAIQCDNPVYYTDKPSGTFNSTPTPPQSIPQTVTTSDILIDFDTNPDPYRVDLRQDSNHVSLKSVSTSANTCKIADVSKRLP